MQVKVVQILRNEGKEQTSMTNAPNKSYGTWPSPKFSSWKPPFMLYSSLRQKDRIQNQGEWTICPEKEDVKENISACFPTNKRFTLRTYKYLFI